MYLKKLESKIEHQDTHATVPDFDITTQDDMFIYKLYNKRNTIPFFIVRMPQLSINIPNSISCG